MQRLIQVLSILFCFISVNYYVNKQTTTTFFQRTVISCFCVGQVKKETFTIWSLQKNSIEMYIVARSYDHNISLPSVKRKNVRTVLTY